MRDKIAEKSTSRLQREIARAAQTTVKNALDLLIAPETKKHLRRWDAKTRKYTGVNAAPIFYF